MKPFVKPVTRLLATLLCLSPCMSGCIAEDLGDCPPEGRLYIKVANVLRHDITADHRVSGVDLFIFDGDGMFIRQVSVSAEDVAARTPLQIESGVTVVAWGNLSGNEWISPVTTPGESTVTLIPDGADYVLQPDDLFHGILGKTQNDINEIVITPKTGRVHVTVHGLDDGSYRIETEQHYSGYTFEGTAISQTSTINVRGMFQPDGNMTTSPAVNVMLPPLESGDGLVVTVLDAYNNILARVDADSENNPLTPLPDQTINVFIDLSGISLSVEVAVTGWDDIFQWKDF